MNQIENIEVTNESTTQRKRKVLTKPSQEFINSMDNQSLVDQVVGIPTKKEIPITKEEKREALKQLIKLKAAGRSGGRENAFAGSAYMNNAALMNNIAKSGTKEGIKKGKRIEKRENFKNTELPISGENLTQLLESNIFRNMNK